MHETAEEGFLLARPIERPVTGAYHLYQAPINHNIPQTYL